MTLIKAPVEFRPDEPITRLWEPPDHLSFSQVSRLSKRYDRACPRAWAYQRLCGIEVIGEEGRGLLVGRAIDKGMEAFFTARMAKPQQSLARAHAIGVELAVAQATTDNLPERYVEMVREATTALINHEAVHVPYSVQQRHDLVAAGAGGQPVTLWGYSDAVLPDGRITDYKFSGVKRWNADGDWNEDYLYDKRDQLLTYYLARAQAHQRGDDIGAPLNTESRLVVVQHAARQKEPVVRELTITLTRSMVPALLAAIAEADAYRRGDVHPPRPGERCKNCPYSERCAHDLERLAFPTSSLVQQP